MALTGRSLEYLPFEVEHPFDGLCENAFDREELDISRGDALTKCNEFPCQVCLKPKVQTCGVSGIWPGGAPRTFQVDVTDFAGTIGVECFQNMDFTPDIMNQSYVMGFKAAVEAGFECTWESVINIGTDCGDGFPDSPGRIEARLSVMTSGEMRLTLIGNPEDRDCTAVPPDKGGKWTIVYKLPASSLPLEAAVYDDIGGRATFAVDTLLTDPWPIPGQWCPEHMDPAALPGNVDTIPLTLEVVRTE